MSGDRWTVPTGGPSPNEGDPAVVTWSIIRDGTTYSPGVGGTGKQQPRRFPRRHLWWRNGTLSNRPWFSIIQQAYDRWSQVSGLTFVYEPNDDGIAFGAGRGVAGVRGDVRIGGRNIDGNSNVLAFNYYPNAGGADPLDGDMVIDTNDNFYRNTSQNSLGLFNVLAHEAGHGIGLGHVIPTNQTKLMEPFVSFAYRGPQYDDILAAQTLYGDDKELLGGARFDLGVIPVGTTIVSDLSIHRNADVDEYQFNVGITGRLSVRFTTRGATIFGRPSVWRCGTCRYTCQQEFIAPTARFYRHRFAERKCQSGRAGRTHRRFNIFAGNGYRVRIAGDSGETQTYELELTTSGPPEPPRLLQFPLTPVKSSIRMSEIRPALTSQCISARIGFPLQWFTTTRSCFVSWNRITRSGGDNDFASFIVINPTYIGFGDTDRIVIARFGQSLPMIAIKLKF